MRTSNLMRQAAVVNGGLIYAARGPLTAGFIRENGAAGAITFQLELGRAMLAANGADRVRATVEFPAASCWWREKSPRIPWPMVVASILAG